MRRRDDEDDGGSLDSLLDTMTNVVGILVIVLVVTQLGVGDVVKRIAASDVVDPAKLQEAQDKLRDALSQRDSLVDQLAAFQPVSDEDVEKQMVELTRQLQYKQVELKRLVDRQKEQADRVAKEKAEADKVTKQNEESTAEQERLSKEVTKLLEEIARLEAILDTTAPRGQLPPKVVTLPNPRPAPAGIQPLTFVCLQNRIYPFNPAALRDKAQKRANFVVKSKRLDRDRAKGIDPDAFVKEFTERPLRDDFFTLELKINGRVPQLTLKPRERRGFGVEDIEQKEGPFEKGVQSIDPRRFYCRFLVLPDSYQAYIAARRVTNKHRRLAGWQPESAEWEYKFNLSTRLGPPPPPPPPSAKKKQPPPRPRPAPRPTQPAKPPKPKNVID